MFHKTGFFFSFPAALHLANQTEEQGYVDCEGTTGPPTGKYSMFNRENLGEYCVPPDFGYDKSKPCIFLSLNRVSSVVIKLVLPVIDQCVLAMFTQYFLENHSHITWLGFKPTTFAILSYSSHTYSYCV